MSDAPSQEPVNAAEVADAADGASDCRRPHASRFGGKPGYVGDMAGERGSTFGKEWVRKLGDVGGWGKLLRSGIGGPDWVEEGNGDECSLVCRFIVDADDGPPNTGASPEVAVAGDTCLSSDFAYPKPSTVLSSTESLSLCPTCRRGSA